MFLGSSWAQTKSSADEYFEMIDLIKLTGNGKSCSTLTSATSSLPNLSF